MLNKKYLCITILLGIIVSICFNHYYFIFGKNNTQAFLLKPYFSKNYELNNRFILHKSINFEVNNRIINLCKIKRLEHLNLIEVDCNEKK